MPYDIYFVNNKPSVLSEPETDKPASTKAAPLFRRRTAAEPVLFIRRTVNLEPDEP